ncbi:MAG: hypothetical protein IT423_20370, partial [Pirellulaceae bacterium]|nr:hypothetical protein [Pirellulaceae bacterium]
MNLDSSAVRLRSACQLISDSGDDRGVHQLFPDTANKLSLSAAAGSLDVATSPTQHRLGVDLAERLNALVTQAESLDQLGKCPVVGITGLLNSGKSSLLASYLGAEGRARVLRGKANNQGT